MASRYMQEYSDPKEFLEVVQPELLKNEAPNGLMLSLALRLASGTLDVGSLRKTTEVYQAVLFEDEVPIAAVLRTIPYIAILATFRQLSESEWDECACAIHLRYPTLPGVRGVRLDVTAFASAWQRRTGDQFTTDETQGLYELRSVVPPLPCSGSMRPASLEDLETVSRWAYEFSVEATRDANKEDAQRLAREKLDAGDIFLWEDDHIVSMAMRTRPTPHGISIAFVYTPPASRSKGYASNLVAALSEHLLGSGFEFCALHTDLKNPTSNRIYQKIGYAQIAEFAEVSFTRK